MICFEGKYCIRSRMMIGLRAAMLLARILHYGRSQIRRVSHGSSSAKYRALREANLPWVLHSGKNCTRGRESFSSVEKCMALGELLFSLSFFAPFFSEAFPHYLKLLAQIWGNFKFFRYISLVFLFRWIFSILLIWTTGAWNHIIWWFKKLYSWYLVYI
jgi:hypothetical protein